MTKNWTNIHRDFAYHGYEWEPNYQAQWESNGFSYEQTQDWINIGLKPTDANFCAWLEQEGYTALAVLNYGDSEELRKEYQTYLTNPKTQVPFTPPKKPNWKLIFSLLALLIFIYLIT